MRGKNRTFLFLFLMRGGTRILNGRGERAGNAVRLLIADCTNDIDGIEIDADGMMSANVFTTVIPKRSVMDEGLLQCSCTPTNTWCTAVFDNAFDIITIADAQGHFQYANPSACRAFGYTQQELLNLSVADVVAPHEQSRLLDVIGSLGVNEVRFGEWMSLRQDNVFFPSEVSVMRMNDGRILGIGRDITERKENQASLERGKERLAVALEVASVGEWEMDLETLEVTTSKIHDAILGYDDGAPTWSYRMALQHVLPQDRAAFESAYQSALQVGEGQLQCRIRRPNGEIRWIELHGRCLRNPEGNPKRVIGSILDITDRKSFEKEQKYAAIIQKFGDRSTADGEVAAPDEVASLYELCWMYARSGMIVAEVDTRRIVGMNPRAEELLGYREQELVGEPVERISPDSEHDYLHEQFRLGAAAASLHSGFHLKQKDGMLVPVEVNTSRIWNLGGHPVILGIFRDVSDLQERDARLATKAFALRAYAAAATALMKASTPIGLMEQVCEAITKDSPFRFAWVGVAEQDAEQSVRVLAGAGPAEGYLRNMQLSWSEKKAIGNGPAGTALRSGETVIVNDCGTDERCAPFRERVKAANINSLVSVPFQMESRPAVLCVYSPDPRAFGSVVVEAFRCLADEIGVGVTTLAERERLNAERQKREAAQQDLAAALNAVIGAISTSMETRDSYTAGHQQRVASIATAIAKEMEWPQDRIEALRVAALVHDIGKIAISAEILTKPTGLSNAEWLLIKEHPEKGYEILKDIPFGWPIAETVRQHQERMDGSGYPRGLKGDDIILGARIVAVADVVEAMASRRPYRAALGLEKALLEIARDAGTKLDADVVRICISLFREKGFALPRVKSPERRTHSVQDGSARVS